MYVKPVIRREYVHVVAALKKVQGTVNLSNRPKKEILILFSIPSNGMTCAGCGFGGRRSKQIGVYRFVHCDIFHVRFGCGRGLQARMYPTWAEQRLSVADGLQILLCKSGAMVSLSTSEAHFECGMPGIEGPSRRKIVVSPPLNLKCQITIPSQKEHSRGISCRSENQRLRSRT